MFPATHFRLKCLKKSPLPFPTPQSHPPARPQHQSKVLHHHHHHHHKPPTTLLRKHLYTIATMLSITPLPIPTPSVPPTTTLPPTPQLPPTPVHKPTSQYPPLCSSTSPSCPGSAHPLPLLPYPCRPPLQPPPSFPTPCRIFSSWDSGGLPYHPNNSQRRSP